MAMTLFFIMPSPMIFRADCLCAFKLMSGPPGDAMLHSGSHRSNADDSHHDDEGGDDGAVAAAFDIQAQV